MSSSPTRHPHPCHKYLNSSLGEVQLTASDSFIVATIHGDGVWVAGRTDTVFVSVTLGIPYLYYLHGGGSTIFPSCTLIVTPKSLLALLVILILS